MADEKTVTVDLKRTYGYGTPTKYYGPGQGVEVPEKLALSLGLLKPKAEKKSAKRAKR